MDVGCPRKYAIVTERKLGLIQENKTREQDLFIIYILMWKMQMVLENQTSTSPDGGEKNPRVSMTIADHVTLPILNCKHWRLWGEGKNVGGSVRGANTGSLLTSTFS